MRKIVLFLMLLPAVVIAQQQDIIFKNEYCQLLDKSTGELLLGEYLENCRVETQQIITKHSKLNTLSIDKFPNYPSLGTEVKKGELYNYNNEIVQVIQDHAITIYNPKDVPALFAFYRAETGSLLWIANEKVNIGDKRTHKDVEYECIQAHMTLESWRPDLTVSVLWKVVPTTSAWTIGVTYKVGDEVTYQGSTYRCRQSHTSISTWNPVAAASLWLKL